jgi:hypothetical protein
MKPQIIGLSAQLQNGKDTVAALILKLTSKESPYSQWTTRRFAGKLKEMTAILLGCTVELLEDIDFKNKELGEEWERWYFTHYKMTTDSNPEGRVSPYFSNEKDALEYQTKLNEYVNGSQMQSERLTPRKILQLLGTEGGRDVIHPNIWVNSTLGDLKDTDRIIITDARFPNEVIGIKRKKGIVVKIVRPSLISTSTHPSETSLNNYTDWDYVIVNDGTMEMLEQKVEQMLRHFNLI